MQYGARANEQALRYQLQNIAVYAAVTTNATNPNASAQINALQQRISANLAPQTGQQSIQDMQAEFAGAQTAIKAATDRQTQLKGMAQTMLDSIEGINPGRGGDQDPGAADQPAGVVSDHLDALPDHADQVSCRSDRTCFRAGKQKGLLQEAFFVLA